MGAWRTSDIGHKLRLATHLGTEEALRPTVDVVDVVHERIGERHARDVFTVLIEHTLLVALVESEECCLVCLHDEQSDI